MSPHSPLQTLTKPMPNPQDSTTAADEIRSLRVHSLLPMMDAIYLFNCFSDNAKVLAATHYWTSGEHYGFVEFASHSIAEFVLETYDGELMPNCSTERYCLSWDTDSIGISWRWDRRLLYCSFFGYDELGHMVDHKTVINLYKYFIPVVAHKRAAGDLQDHELEAAYPNSRLKLTDMPLIHCPDMYRGGRARYQKYQHRGPSHTIQQNNMMRPLHLNVYHGGYDNYQQHGLFPQAGYDNYQQHGFYRQPSVYQPPYQQLQTQWTVGSAAHTLGQLTHVPKARPKLVCSKEKSKSNSKEKELYLCFNEINMLQRSCYVLRTIALSELLACSCKFSSEAEKIAECNICASKTKPESELRQRAWLFTGEKVPASCGGEEARIPEFMGCCASDSRIFFAGGMVPPPDRKAGASLVPSADVYSFAPESCSWQKHDLSFVKEKPDPLLFWVNGNLYCLARRPIGLRLERPTFEVYNSSLGECEVLPDPPLYLPELERQYYMPDLSAVLVGTKILIWSMVKWNKDFDTPIMCFDVNDKEKKWRQCAAKPFPFVGRALVLDVKGATSTKFMFYFRHELIYVSTLVVDDGGDIAMVNDQCLKLITLVDTFMHNIDHPSHAFVDLGDQKVGFILCGNVLFSEKDDTEEDDTEMDDTEKDDTCSSQKARVLVVVFQYEVAHSKSFGFFLSEEKILATRTFEYNYHSPGVSSIDLIGSFVV